MTFDASGLKELPELLADSASAGGTIFTLFDRITIPAGGSTTFDVPTAESTTSEKSIQGVVMHAQRRRAFWESNEPREGNPPDCFSDDGEFGNGEPGGSCKTCPHNQWGSAIGGGRGKSCKEMLQLYILRDGEALPVTISLPPSSLGVYQKYVARLARERSTIRSTVTEFGLEKVSSDSGIAYSRIVCKAVDSIDAENTKTIRSISARLAPAIMGELTHDEAIGELDSGYIGNVQSSVDEIPKTTLESNPAPPEATATEKAPDAMFASLTSLTESLGVPPETLAEHVSETYGGRMYLQLSTNEILETIQWVSSNFNQS